MKTLGHIAFLLPLFVARVAVADVLPGRDQLRQVVVQDVFHGVDTFCIPTYLGREELPGESISIEGPRRDALVAAGVIDAASRLTDYGWEQIDFDDGGCLTGGRFSLTVDEVPANSAESQVVSVTVKAQTSANGLSPWARNPTIYGAFPEITSMLDGMRFRVAFLREGRRWHAKPENPFPFRIPESVKIDPALEAEGKRSPLPGKPALREMWLKEFGDWTAGKGCIDLAGTEAYPVDERVIDERSGTRFAVAIYEMLERNPVEQRVLTVTLPRIEALERAGVLKSTATRGPKHRAQWPGRLYMLAPEYERFLLRPFPYPPCLFAGEYETAVTATKIRGIEGKMIVRDHYVSVAPWARSPEVLERLPDLRKALDGGALCMHRLMLDERKWNWGATGSCR